MFRRGGAGKIPVWTFGRFVNAGLFILALLGTGITLGYYSIGSTALAKYHELKSTRIALEKKGIDAVREVEIKSAALRSKSDGQGDSKDAAAVAERAALSGALIQAKADAENIFAQQKALEVELKTVPERLGRWAMQPCRASSNFVFRSALCAGVDMPNEEVAEARQQVASVERAASSAGESMSPSPAVWQAAATSREMNEQRTLRGSLVDVEAARTVVSRMNDVYLPLLLGFLGAQAFVLRRMSKEIAERTFAKGSAFNHVVRIGLGALAGLASTWLLTPEGVGGAPLKALPSWALAFVAGYGIELVFAFMDRIILAFTAPAK